MNTVFDSRRCRQLRIPGPAAPHHRVGDGQQLPRHRRQRHLRTSVEDPTQHATSYTYDKLNRLSSVTDALNETTTYGYDANGNEISVTNPLDQTTQYGYDAANRQTAITNALNQTTTIAYDAIWGLNLVGLW